MQLIYIILFSLSFSQIQYGGSPKYELIPDQIKSHNVDHLRLIEKNFHPMVLQYANEYDVNINILSKSTKTQKNEYVIYNNDINLSSCKAPITSPLCINDADESWPKWIPKIYILLKNYFI